MTVGIVGLGLIGGSIAKAFRENSGDTVLGCDLDAKVSGYAELSGIVDGALTQQTLPTCDLLILAAYPSGAKAYLTQAAPYIRQGAVVLDCLGVKTPICELGFALAKSYGFTFVGGHPMAGSEHSGIKYASADLFVGTSMVLIPPDSDDIALLQRVKAMLKPLGFGHITVTTAQEHDARIGFTSQLPHLLSNALVQSPGAARHKGFSAGSFRDMTRVAELSPALWTELFLENRGNLLGELDTLLASLTSYRMALAERDEAALLSLLTAGSLRKKELNKL